MATVSASCGTAWRGAPLIGERHPTDAMPRFRSAEISDEELRVVTSYMVWLRKQH